VEFKRIKQALTDLDLGALEARFGTDKHGDGTTVITYGGRTATLDSRIVGFAPSDEAPPVARPLARVTVVLASLLEGPGR
jgi:hypothetical protein